RRSSPEMEQHHRHRNDLTSNDTLQIKELQLPCHCTADGHGGGVEELTEKLLKSRLPRAGSLRSDLVSLRVGGARRLSAQGFVKWV
ncbi:hypothetical protein ABZT45_51085, partial [Streptomyces sp. NPDC005356]|uniref:hypothetical protein n=1 Tax=Streptomyces sp. NPDC005356 TaxID=3157167 RepID=UPI0033A8E481